MPGRWRRRRRHRATGQGLGQNVGIDLSRRLTVLLQILRLMLYVEIASSLGVVVPSSGCKELRAVFVKVEVILGRLGLLGIQLELNPSLVEVMACAV